MPPPIIVGLVATVFALICWGCLIYFEPMKTIQYWRSMKRQPKPLTVGALLAIAQRTDARSRVQREDFELLAPLLTPRVNVARSAYSSFDSLMRDSLNQLSQQRGLHSQYAMMQQAQLGQFGHLNAPTSLFGQSGDMQHPT